MFDENHDGEVSMDEFMKAADKDGNGAITHMEFCKAMAALASAPESFLIPTCPPPTLGLQSNTHVFMNCTERDATITFKINDSADVQQYDPENPYMLSTEKVATIKVTAQSTQHGAFPSSWVSMSFDIAQVAPPTLQTTSSGVGMKTTAARALIFYTTGSSNDTTTWTKYDVKCHATSTTKQQFRAVARCKGFVESEIELHTYDPIEQALLMEVAVSEERAIAAAAAAAADVVAAKAKAIGEAAAAAAAADAAAADVAPAKAEPKTTDDVNAGAGAGVGAGGAADAAQDSGDGADIPVEGNVRDAGDGGGGAEVVTDDDIKVEIEELLKKAAKSGGPALTANRQSKKSPGGAVVCGYAWYAECIFTVEHNTSYTSSFADGTRIWYNATVGHSHRKTKFDRGKYNIILKDDASMPKAVAWYKATQGRGIDWGQYPELTEELLKTLGFTECLADAPLRWRRPGGRTNSHFIPTQIYNDHLAKTVESLEKVRPKAAKAEKELEELFKAIAPMVGQEQASKLEELVQKQIAALNLRPMKTFLDQMVPVGKHTGEDVEKLGRKTRQIYMMVSSVLEHERLENELAIRVKAPDGPPEGAKLTIQVMATHPKFRAPEIVFKYFTFDGVNPNHGNEKLKEMAERGNIGHLEESEIKDLFYRLFAKIDTNNTEDGKDRLDHDKLWVAWDSKLVGTGPGTTKEIIAAQLVRFQEKERKKEEANRGRKMISFECNILTEIDADNDGDITAGEFWEFAHMRNQKMGAVMPSDVSTKFPDFIDHQQFLVACGLGSDPIN